jgi:hypothetical protein
VRSAARRDCALGFVFDENQETGDGETPQTSPNQKKNEFGRPMRSEFSREKRLKCKAVVSETL